MTNLGVIACQGIPTTGFTVQSLGVLGSSWLTLTGLALLVSLLMLALVYVLANFTRNQTLLAWSKFELFQVLATVCLVIFFMVWVIDMCKFDMKVLNDPVAGINYAGRNMFEIVDDYFNKLEYLGWLMFAQIMYVSKIIVLLQKVTYFSSPLGLGTTDNPTDSLGQLNNVIFLLASGFATSYLVIGVQNLIIQYMAYASLYYLIPFGVFFRAFEPTRQFGGVLTGLAFSFFLFYPVIIVANDYVMRSSVDPVTHRSGMDQVLYEVQSALGVANAAPGAGVNDKDKLEQLGKGIGEGTVEPSDLVEGLGSAVIFMVKPSAFYFVAAVVLPVLNFVVLIEVTRTLTGLFGEPVDVSNLTRMI